MSTTITNCRFCGMTHGPTCPTVKAIEYFEDGITIKRVEFKTPADYMTVPPIYPYPQPVGPWPVTYTSGAQ